MNRAADARRARCLAFAVALAPLASCGTLVGLHDHELGPSPDAAVEDAGPCGACAPGYACTDGRCDSEVVEVGASATHACAVLRGGELWCWGKSQLGALGVHAADTPERCGAYACRHSPGRVPGVASVRHVALTDDSTCALLQDASVWCWGKSARGELGHDPAGDLQCPRHASADAGAEIDACNPTPARVAIAGGAGVVEVVGGNEGFCARTMDNNVYCWGDDYLGEQGVVPFPMTGFVATPSRIAGIPGDATSVALSEGYGHGCALRVFGTVWCWGSNVAGELGHPKMQSGDQGCIFGAPCNPTAQAATGAAGSAMAAGQLVSCVRRGNGTVACWGGNDAAQLGNGASVDSDSHPAPEDVSGLSNIVTIAMPFETGFAIDGSAHVFAWGLSSNGALGVPAVSIACANGTCVPKAVAVPTLDGAVQIAPTRAGGVARKSDATVWTWGANDLAQLGHAAGDGDDPCRDGPCRETPSRLQGLP